MLAFFGETCQLTLDKVLRCAKVIIGITPVTYAIFHTFYRPLYIFPLALFPTVIHDRNLRKAVQFRRTALQSPCRAIIHVLINILSRIYIEMINCRAYLVINLVLTGKSVHVAIVVEMRIKIISKQRREQLDTHLAFQVYIAVFIGWHIPKLSRLSCTKHKAHKFLVEILHLVLMIHQLNTIEKCLLLAIGIAHLSPVARHLVVNLVSNKKTCSTVNKCFLYGYANTHPVNSLRLVSHLACQRVFLAGGHLNGFLRTILFIEYPVMFDIVLPLTFGKRHLEWLFPCRE